MSKFDFSSASLFHIIKVTDYKGGELNTKMNIEPKDFIEELAERFFDDVKISKDEPLDKILERVHNHDLGEFDLYAGGGMPVFKFYHTNDEGILELVTIDDFRGAIAQFLYHTKSKKKKNLNTFYINWELRFVSKIEVPKVKFDPAKAVFMIAEWDLGLNCPNDGRRGIYASKEEAKAVAYNAYVSSGTVNVEDWEEDWENYFEVYDLDLSDENRL